MPGPDRTILRDALTISVAVGVIGISFGVIATGRGVSVLEAQAMSLFVFAGASQFVLVAGVGSSLAAAVVAALLLNSRHVAYGLSLAPVLRGPRWRRAAASHVVIDESTAYALAQDDPARSRQGFFAVGLLLFTCWQAGTAIGAAAGTAIDYEAFGIDAAFPAALLALVAPQLRDRTARIAGFAGIAIALVATEIAPRGLPIALAALGVLVGLGVERARR